MLFSEPDTIISCKGLLLLHVECVLPFLSTTPRIKLEEATYEYEYFIFHKDTLSSATSHNFFPLISVGRWKNRMRLHEDVYILEGIGGGTFNIFHGLDSLFQRMWLITFLIVTFDSTVSFLFACSRSVRALDSLTGTWDVKYNADSERLGREIPL